MKICQKRQVFNSLAKDRIIQEAKKLGIGLMKQCGDAVEYKTDWVRVY